MKLKYVDGDWYIGNSFTPIFCWDFGGYFLVPDSVYEVELVISDKPFPESILLKLDDRHRIYLPEYDIKVPTYWGLKNIVRKMDGTCYIGIHYEYYD